MMRRPQTPSASLTVILIAIAVPMAAQPAMLAVADGAEANAAVRIEPRQWWSTWFGETEATLTFDVASREPLDGRLTWTYSSGQRTLARGEVPVKGRSTVVSIPLHVPPVGEGVVLDTQLALTVVEGGETLAELVRPMWVYPQDPFFGRSAWLEALNITLYDPTRDGKTAGVFREMSIPFKSVRGVGAVESLADGVLVIGEGVSLADHRALGAALAAAAARGVPVLCLAPSDGSLPLPGAGDPASPSPSRVEFRRQDVIRQFDKRLDAESWPPAGRVVASRLAIASGRGGVRAEVSDAQQAWPWLEVEYPRDGATLVVCGFGLIESWDDGPTPRVLLARLFEKLDPADKGKNSDELGE
ncbi:MAG: hypothetical protein RIC55_32260 [Pirellulaceae bacterium]